MSLHRIVADLEYFYLIYTLHNWDYPRQRENTMLINTRYNNRELESLAQIWSLVSLGQTVTWALQAKVGHGRSSSVSFLIVRLPKQPPAANITINEWAPSNLSNKQSVYSLQEPMALTESNSCWRATPASVRTNTVHSMEESSSLGSRSKTLQLHGARRMYIWQEWNLKGPTNSKTFLHSTVLFFCSISVHFSPFLFQAPQHRMKFTTLVLAFVSNTPSLWGTESKL